jgi:hypothetical protein
MCSAKFPSKVVERLVQTSRNQVAHFSSLQVSDHALSSSIGREIDDKMILDERAQRKKGKRMY